MIILIQSLINIDCHFKNKKNQLIINNVTLIIINEKFNFYFGILTIPIII